MARFDNLALIAISLCVLGATECSVVLLRHREPPRPRLATSLTFFALSWAVLLPYYALLALLRSLRAQTQLHGPLGLNLDTLGLILEWLPTYGNALLLWAAEPLVREAQNQNQNVGRLLTAIDHIVERSIYLMVFGHAIIFAAGIDDQTVGIRVFDVALFGLGIFFLGRVLYVWHDAFPRNFLWFLSAAIGYFILVVIWKFKPHGQEMGNPLIVMFAIGKLLLSATFIALVMRIPNVAGANAQLVASEPPAAAAASSGA